MEKVVFIDDERTVLRELKKIFSEKKNYVYFQNGYDALEYLNENEVDLVCCDIVMPKIDGFQVLREVKKAHPTIPRLAICDFIRKKDIENLAREDLANAFILKPWKKNELKLGIEGILDVKSALMSSEIITFINSIEELPSLPKLYNELVEYMRDDKDIEDIANLIEKDQAIASKILKMANSAFYGRKTGSITKAIMKIGLNNLKNIVLTNSVFSNNSVKMKELDALWNHTLYTNKITIGIYSECLNKKIPGVFASAGLLHDIGKLILHSKYNDDYRNLIDSVEDDGSLVEVEQKKLGVNHQNIGAYLLLWWDLPFAYVEAAMYHHTPSDDRIVNSELVNVVHLANYYSNKFLMDGEDKLDLDYNVFDRLNITERQVERLVDEIINK